MIVLKEEAPVETGAVTKTNCLWEIQISHSLFVYCLFKRNGVCYVSSSPSCPMFYRIPGHCSVYPRYGVPGCPFHFISVVVHLFMFATFIGWLVSSFFRGFFYQNNYYYFKNRLEKIHKGRSQNCYRAGKISLPCNVCFCVGTYKIDNQKVNRIKNYQRFDCLIMRK